MNKDFSQYLGSIVLPIIEYSKKYFIESTNIILKTQHNNDDTFSILDLGCSFGRNSNTLLNEIIPIVLNENHKRAIDVYFNDLEISDFNKLFIELKSNPESFLKLHNDIDCFVIGKNFHKQVIRDNSIDLIFSTISIHWSDYNEKYHSCKESILNEKRDENIETHLIDSFTNILELREKELKSGGVFISVFVGAGNENSHHCWRKIKQIYYEMANKGLCEKDDIDKMSIPFNMYSKDDIMNAIKIVESKSSLKLIKHIEKDISWSSINDDISIQKQHVIQLNSYTENNLKGFINSQTKQQVDDLHDQVSNELVKRLTTDECFDFKFKYHILIVQKNK